MGFNRIFFIIFCSYNVSSHNCFCWNVFLEDMEFCISITRIKMFFLFLWEVTVARCCIRNQTIDLSRWSKCAYSTHTHCHVQSVQELVARDSICVYVNGQGNGI